MRTWLPLALAFAACEPPAPLPRPATFTVDDDAVRLHVDAPQALHFPTAAVAVGRPLPGLPVTARVTTAPSLTAPSFAPLTGRVVTVRVKLGDRVAPGERLVLVQTTELPALRHALASAKLEVKTKAAIVERMRRLVASRVGSEHDLIVAESQLAEAQLAVKTAEARLKSLAVTTEGDTAYWILANRAGTVVQLDATQGTQVGPERDRPVVTIADLSELVIVGDAPQRDAALLRPGMTAEIHTSGDPRAPIRGVLDAVADVVDPERQTVPLRVLVDNAGGLRPNAYVELVFTPPDGLVVLVPVGAVVSEGVAAVVFVEESPGVLRRRPVELGRRSKTTVEVLSGLQAGERVVTAGALLLLNAVDVDV